VVILKGRRMGCGKTARSPRPWAPLAAVGADPTCPRIRKPWARAVRRAGGVPGALQPGSIERLQRSWLGCLDLVL